MCDNSIYSLQYSSFVTLLRNTQLRYFPVFLIGHLLVRYFHYSDTTLTRFKAGLGRVKYNINFSSLAFAKVMQWYKY